MIYKQKIHSLLISGLNYRGRDVVKFPIDLGLIIVAAGWAWFESFGQVSKPGNPLPFMSVVIFARLAIYLTLRLHRTSWRDVSRYDVFWLSVSAALGPPLIGLLFLLLPDPFTLNALVRPEHVLVTEPTLYLLLLSGARITVRALACSRPQQGKRRILIAGARDAGRSLAFQIQESSVDYRVVGFVDDELHVKGRRIRGLPVLGKLADIGHLIEEHNIQHVMIAIPSLSPDRLRLLLEYCEPTGAAISIVPPIGELMGGKPDVASLRKVRMEDLLPRPEVKLDRDSISKYIRGRTVLVTGGGGSIGGELCRQLLSAGVGRLLVLGRGENSVFEMMQELAELNGHCQLIPVICDVRDRAGLERVFQRYQPKVVFHAAAHKHVPLMEQYPAEAVKNNVLGTHNVAALSVKYGVERFVLVSTDKAVDPRSVMGATKQIAEMIVKAYATAYGADMVSVRFGNVLGSRGSVVPVMARQISRRLPITVTDPDMVRYFMTIPEAVQLILQAGAIGSRGEVFVLDMGHPVRIMDLARDLIRLSGLVPHQDIPIRIIGRRPGEKLREDMLTNLQTAGAEKRGNFYIAPSPEVEMAQIQRSVAQLGEAAEMEETEAVLTLMQRIVPNFTPDGAQLAPALAFEAGAAPASVGKLGISNVGFGQAQLSPKERTA